MLKRHQMLLNANHEFLVNEIPMEETLKAIRGKHILTWHDFDQLKTLRHQGRKALARYFLAVLPHRGQRAFQAFLESLQEANAQHLVELLLQQAGVMNMEDLFNQQSPEPVQNNVRFPWSDDLVLGQDGADVCWVHKSPDVFCIPDQPYGVFLLMTALLQRGERAYQAFMAALIQKGYSSVFHTIQETTTEFSGSEDESGRNSDTMGDEVVIESDDDIKRETSTSIHNKKSLEDILLNDINSRNSRADDALLALSSDLKTGNDDWNEGRNADKPKISDNQHNNQDSKTDNKVKALRRKSNAGNLNAVEEETEAHY
uniref:CARD domain-containing protein n=1 Tax=Biomphalaria glabrata TaxID=6526 RepID=A0A2C9LTN2_BIOGL